MSRLPPRILGIALGLLVAAVAAASAAGLVFSSRSEDARVARAVTGGDPDRAPAILRRYGCSGCHTIPGIPGADGQVGGSLADIRGRVYVGGVANNTSENLIGWIVAPQRFSPASAMPQTGITEAEARDVAAYLYAR